MTPELEQEIRAEFEKWYVENAFNYAANPLGSRDCSVSWKAFLAGRASALGELEQVGGLYQFGPRETCWWNHSPTYKPAEYFDAEPGQTVWSIKVFRLPPEIEKEMKE